MAQPLAYAASFGKIDEFDPDTDNWDIYCERLDQCFTARNIDENTTDLKRAIMLSEMGKKAYTLLRNLCAPSKPDVAGPEYPRAQIPQNAYCASARRRSR